MSNIKEYILFKRMMMPAALQFLFWAAMGGTLYGTWWLFAHGNWAWIMSLVFGTLATRLIFEAFILKYQTVMYLRDIRDRLNEQTH